jgi:hypothetical protein
MNPTPLEIRTTAVLAYRPMGDVLLHDFAPLCGRTPEFSGRRARPKHGLSPQPCRRAGPLQRLVRPGRRGFTDEQVRASPGSKRLGRLPVHVPHYRRSAPAVNRKPSTGCRFLPRPPQEARRRGQDVMAESDAFPVRAVRGPGRQPRRHSSRARASIPTAPAWTQARRYASSSVAPREQHVLAVRPVHLPRRAEGGVADAPAGTMKPVQAFVDGQHGQGLGDWRRKRRRLAGSAGKPPGARGRLLPGLGRGGLSGPPEEFRKWHRRNHEPRGCSRPLMPLAEFFRQRG